MATTKTPVKAVATKKIAVKKPVTPKAAIKKAAPKKAVPAKQIKSAPLKTTVTPPKQTVYIDSSFFFPVQSTDGYMDDFQNGRYFTTGPGDTLQAPILLPIGIKILALTIFFKNTSDDDIQVNLVRKSIDHTAGTEEYLVSSDFCSGGTGVAPDYFAANRITHFADADIIKDKYLYYLMISNTGKVNATQIRTLRGIRIEFR